LVVSRPTPTIISTAVPPNGKFRYCWRSSQMKKKFGRIETTAR